MRTSGEMGVDSPNIDSLDPWAHEVTRVEKPWGYELIWAVTDTYVGKVLFVKAGHALSLQFHREKDEAWFVQSGRAKLELGEVGESVCRDETLPGSTAPRVASLPRGRYRECAPPRIFPATRAGKAARAG